MSAPVLLTYDSLPLVAGGAARVTKGLARFGHELPLVARGMKRELEDSVGVGVPDLAVGADRAEGIVAPTSGAHDELSYASCGVGFPARFLRGEALVVVVVSTQDHIGPRVIQSVPARYHLRVVAVLRPRREYGMMPVSKRAGGG